MSFPSNVILDKKIDAVYARSVRSEISPIGGPTIGSLTALSAWKGQKLIFYIPTGVNLLQNTLNSGLRFQANFVPAATGATIRLTEVGAHGFISRVTVKHGGTQLEDNPSYQMAAKQLLEMQIPMGTNLDKNNILLGTRSTFVLDCSGNTILSSNVKKANSGDLIVQNAASLATITKSYFVPLVSLLGLLCPRGYLPLMFMTQGQIALEVTLAPNIFNVACSDAEHGIFFDKVAYVQELIQFTPAAAQIVREENLRRSNNGIIELPITSMENFQFTTGTLGNNAKLYYLIGCTNVSLKALVASTRVTNQIGQAFYFPTSSVMNGLASYQYKIGADLCPQQPVDTIVDMYVESAKCFGTLGDSYFSGNNDLASYSQNVNTLPPSVQATEYYNQIGSGGFFAGINLEAYPSSDTTKLWAGQDVRTSQVVLYLNYANIVATQMTIDVFAYSDKKLILNNNGVASIDY